MTLPGEERDRLLWLYQERVDTYPGVDAEFGWRWRSWCKTLLSYGGSLVVPPRNPDPDLDQLLRGASAFEPTARLVPGDPGECHRNIAVLWIDAAIASIGTGYALSADELWRQHSWGVGFDGGLVETTDERCGYVGIALPARAASMQFAGSNAQDHLQTVLQQRGPRATELISMIRELAGVSRPRPDPDRQTLGDNR
jgi:hypothetical protein